MIEFAPFFMKTQFLSKISLLVGRSSPLLTDFSTLIPACPPSLSPDSWSPACTYSPRRTTTRATHTRRRSSEISHGSHGGHVCVCCSCCCCFFWGTTGEGVHQTQQHNQIWFSQPTYQWCTTQRRTALKNAISVLMSGYTVWERSRFLQQVRFLEQVRFLDMVRFSTSVHSPMTPVS